MYEMFLDILDIKEEATSDAQGEGHAITLQPERPSIVGDTRAEWDPRTETLDRLVEEPPAAEAAPEAPCGCPRPLAAQAWGENARV